MSSSVRNWASRVTAIVFIVAAFGFAGFQIWKHEETPRGSETDEMVLVCTKCGQESVLSSGEFVKLAIDPKTGDHKCPKCGALAAKIAPTRCEHCGRAILPQPAGSPLVCPYCKASLDVFAQPLSQPKSP